MELIHCHFQIFCQKLEKVLLLLSNLFFIALISINLLEITLRFLNLRSFIWVQEMSSLLISWSVFFAGSIVSRKGIDPCLSFFLDKFFPVNFQRALKIFFQSVIICFLCLVLFYSFKFQFIQALYKAQYLKITRNWFSFPVIVFAGTSILFTFEELLLTVFPRSSAPRYFWNSNEQEVK